MFHLAKIRFIPHLLNPQENKLSPKDSNKKNPESLSTFRILREQFLTVVHPQGLEPWTH